MKDEDNTLDAIGGSFSSKAAEMIPLRLLNLDSRNPRFGAEKGGRVSQSDILDFIVENFGVEDVLSSLAYNGYFSAEPLIARREQDGTYTVVEGNRRLSACLILAGSDRAKNHRRRTEEYQAVLATDWTDETLVPVQVFDKGDNSLRLNAYLGVRHIMSAKAWDSYAKAAWIHEVVSSGEMTLEQISQVTGDKNRTIRRLLEGYYFINQLKSEAHFLPENSLRKGRGSNPEFPFSWVYTILDYGVVRDWLDLPQDEPANEKPIKRERTADAAALVTYMFGDKGRGRIAAVEDSRQLSSLAAAVGDPTKRDWLASGKTVEQIESLSKAPVDQFAKALNDAHDGLALALKIASEGGLSKDETFQVIGKSKDVANLAASVFKRLRDMDEPESF
ncbi:ParB N-terminal domain-containing protein [Stutzerimonas nitrititolerans]|uniref:ParB N-terminal domain-containing protein n=1 Tax=Stutzerimonas nitrititolerans TaxID=2482751 RepID=UPI0028A916F7|nr:ParB N-terminal domain-containing protein [Stutzerimonas nitrititolerans]